REEGKIPGGEARLRRADALALLRGGGEVAVAGEVPERPRAGELHAGVPRAVVVERRQEHGRAELPLVELIARLLVVHAEPDGEAGDDLLANARRSRGGAR